MRSCLPYALLLAGGLCAAGAHAAELSAGVSFSGQTAGDPPGFTGFFGNSGTVTPPSVAISDIQAFGAAINGRGGVVASVGEADANVLRARSAFAQTDNLAYTLVGGNLNNTRNSRDLGSTALLSDTVTTATTFMAAPNVFFDRTVSASLDVLATDYFRTVAQDYVASGGLVTNSLIRDLSSVRVDAGLTAYFENIANPDDYYSFAVGSTVRYGVNAFFDADGTIAINSQAERFNFTTFEVGDGAGGVRNGGSNDAASVNGLEGELVGQPLSRSANAAGPQFTFRAGAQYSFSLFLVCNVRVENTPAGTGGSCDASNSAYWNGLSGDGSSGDFALTGTDGVDYRSSSPLSPAPVGQVSPVPLPAGAGLLAGAMLAMGAFRGRRQPRRSGR